MNLKTDILVDKPLNNPKLDKFGYKDFAKHLADSIVAMNAIEGLVIALYGKWGTGKTTIVNFIMYYLETQNQKNTPIVIRFNPWWFTGEDRLIRHFFQQLRLAFEKSKVNDEEIGRELSEALGKYAENINDLATELNLPWHARGVIKLLLKCFGGVSKDEDIVKLKESIFEKLKKLDKKIIVIIDDIDRLTGEEIRQIFRLVKAVGDFPNVIYLLSFDKQIVVESLKDLQNLPGDEYLEKIIQVPFEVPMPEKTQLNVMFVEKINNIIEDKPEDEVYNSNHWGNIFFDGLEHYIATPRKATQLYNALSVTYPVVKNEVNNVDFIAIEAIRIFSPTAYDLIRQNRDKFAGLPLASYSSSREPEVKELEKFHQAWLTTLPEFDQLVLRHVIPVLFPKLRSFFGGYVQDDRDETQWRLLNRVSHPDVFSVYFRLAVSPDTISSLEMETIISLISDKKIFEKRLLELSEQKFTNGTTHAREVLGRLRDYGFKKIPQEQIPNVIEALFEIGDKLLLENDKGNDMFDFDNDVRIERALWPLLKRNSKIENFHILKKAIQRGKALSTMAREIAVLGRQHGKMGASPEPTTEQFLTIDQLSKLEQMVVRKIKRAVKHEALLDLPQLTGILHRWKEWAGEKEVQEWFKKIIRSDKNLLKLLVQFVTTTRTYSSSGVSTNSRLDPDWFKPFVQDTKKLAERVKKLSKSKKITEKQKTAVSQFLKEYEMRQKGKDPSNPLATWEDKL